LFVLPSLLILILLSWVYIAWGHTALVAGLFYGIKPAVTAIVVQAVHRIGSRTLNNSWLWAISGASFVAIFALRAPFPAIIAGAALLGYIGGRIAPERFQAGGGPAGSGNSQGHGPAWIDDDTPTPDHAKFRWQRLARLVTVGAALWLLPMGLLTALWGWDHTLTQMAWFFTKAALLTFGGAYAVLPYVYQGAVEHYGWLTPLQMIDGLALGETTPGPLIMVVAYVGFVGSYTKALFGPDALFLAGVLAATVVTWFTFLPSFLFILAGGPLVEATHGQLRYTAPLAAISAAVVGKKRSALGVLQGEDIGAEMVADRGLRGWGARMGVRAAMRRRMRAAGLPYGPWLLVSIATSKHRGTHDERHPSSCSHSTTASAHVSANQ
jgi:chromate transporter